MSNTSNPAYPVYKRMYENNQDKIDCKGLSKREAFAMAALQGILSNPMRANVGENPAKDAVLYADELLKQLEA
jgi:hypothetical protein